MLPDLAGADAHALSQQELLPQLAALSAETGLMLAVTLAERPAHSTGDEERAYKSLLLLDGGELVCHYRQTHLDDAEVAAGFAPGEAPPPLIDTRLGRARPARRPRTHWRRSRRVRSSSRAPRCLCGAPTR